MGFARGRNLVRNYICRAREACNSISRRSSPVSAYPGPTGKWGGIAAEKEGTHCKEIANGMKKRIWRHAPEKIRKDRNRVPLHSGSPT